MCNKKVKIRIYGETESEIVSFKKLCILIEIYGPDNIQIIDEY